MYESPKKMTKKKKIELGILIFLFIWVLLFLVNYIRYTNSKAPILALKLTTNYDDGEVIEYYSLGYVYRIYDRNAIKKEEFVPFFKLRENPASESDLPKTYDDYNVPENANNLDKYKGLLYFYDENYKLAGTYKCINSERNCEKAVGGIDDYDILNNDYLTKRDPRKLEFIYNRFAFVDDSKEQEKEYGQVGYFKTIYLLDVEENKILARFSDVKDSGYDDFKEVGTGDDHQYIVKDYDNNKWGIIKITEEGEIEEVLPFEYDSINYDIDTEYYIMCKDNAWFGYDLKSNEKVTVDSSDVIFDLWYNNNKTLYYKVGILNNDNVYNFKIYRRDGNSFLVSDNISLIMEKDSYIMYLSNNNSKLHFIDYTATEKDSIKLYFTNLDSDKLHHPAFNIEVEEDDYLIIYVYQGRDLENDYDNIFINTVNWD